MSYGSEFGEIAPKDPANNAQILVTPFQTLPAGSVGVDIDNNVITPITPINSFRLGQQIMFWFGIANPSVTNGLNTNWITRLRLKLWWLRPNLEKRAPGAPTTRPAQELPPGSGWLPIDRSTFGLGPAGPPNGGVLNNRYCWMPSPKRLDITPFDVTPPPPTPRAGNSDSILLDESLVWDLQDPTLAAYANGFSAGTALAPAQVPSRWSVLFYPAMGYALGVTADPTYSTPLGQGVPTPPVLISCTFATGTLGGTLFQESVG